MSLWYRLVPVTCAVALAATACASSRARSGADDIDDPIDAPAVDAAAGDAPSGDGPAAVDARPDAAPAAVAALVLTEVSLAPNGAELIELYNPTAAVVDLHDYYLTDVPTYFRLPGAGQTVDTSDFIVRFPPGATIGANAVVTVALDTAANFQTATTVAPTYSITGATMMSVAVSGGATLTNGGEPVVLFFWDGQSDRVTDVDIMIAGVPSAANALITKSALVVDGPDADTSGSAYATDAMTIAAQPTAPGTSLSTKRLALPSAATETQSGGNGVGGRDQTSERTGTTWDSAAFTALTPGVVPVALIP